MSLVFHSHIINERICNEIYIKYFNLIHIVTFDLENMNKNINFYALFSFFRINYRNGSMKSYVNRSIIMFPVSRIFNQTKIVK